MCLGVAIAVDDGGQVPPPAHQGLDVAPPRAALHRLPEEGLDPWSGRGKRLGVGGGDSETHWD